MSDDPRKILKSVVETLYRQSLVLGVMTNGFNDLVIMCLSNLPKCNHEGCENPTTFKKRTGVSATLSVTDTSLKKLSIRLKFKKIGLKLITLNILGLLTNMST